MKHRMGIGILAFIAAGSLHAGGLSRTYKEWPKNPESYFMTGEEKSVWKKVKTDDEAEKFISDYKARRGDEFFKSLEPRIAAADKYFSAGSVKGSRTLRGKVIVMFGPPSDVSQAAAASGGGLVRDGSLGIGGGGGKAGGGSGAETLSSGGGGDALSAPPPPVKLPTFSLVYDEQAAPKPIGRAFRVELKVVSNAEQEPADSGDLDQKFEAVAQASIQKSNG